MITLFSAVIDTRYTVQRYKIKYISVGSGTQQTRVVNMVYSWYPFSNSSMITQFTLDTPNFLQSSRERPNLVTGYSWVRGCKQCQQRNNPPTEPNAPVVSIESIHPFQKIWRDIMGHPPASANGNCYILGVTELFTKWAEAFRLEETS